MKKFLFFLSIAVPSFLFCADIGSDTAVTRFNNVVTINNGDRVAGFAALYGGFSFASGTTTAFFDSFFPVSGSIAINGGNLALNKDLILNDVLTVGALGNIYGNRHQLQFPVIDTIPTLTGAAFACAPYLLSTTAVALDFDTFSWSFDDQFLVAAEPGVGEVAIYALVNNAPVFKISPPNTGAASNEFGQIAWRPTGYIFALAREGGSAGNPSVRSYSYVPGTNTVTSVSNLTLTGDGRACAWHPSGNYLAVGFSSAGGPTGVSLYSVNSGGTLTFSSTFTITPNRLIGYQSIAWDVTGTYLAVGMATNGTNPELIVLTFNQGTVTFTGINASVSPIIGQTIDSLDWGKGPNYLAIGLATGTNNVNVYSFNANGGGMGAGTLSRLASVSGIGQSVVALCWSPSGTCFSIGTTATTGTGYFNTYSFDGSTLALVSNIVFSGVITTDEFEGIRYSPSGRYIALADDLTTENIYIYGVPSASCYTWTDLIIEQSSNTIYHDLCLTFTGQSIWDGNGSIATFQSTCTMYIAANSSLMFRNMSLVGLQQSLIIPLDTTSSVSFNNMSVVLSSSYNFNLGRLDIIGDVIVQGEGNSFIFSSTGSGHINSNSQFMFDTGTTFMYAPNNNSRTNFVFDDNTGQLVLNTATLSTSSIGLQLTQGMIFFDGLCMLVNQGGTLNTSLQFGDGVTSANNVTVRWLPACNVQLIQGQLRMDNV